MVLQEIYVTDYLYYNSGDRVSDLDYPSTASVTTNGDYITITTSTSGEKEVKLPVTLSDTDEWMYETTIAAIGTMQPIAINYNNTNWYGGHSASTNQWFANSGTNDAYTQAYQVGDKLTVIRQNSKTTVKVNDHTISDRTVTSPNTSFWVGFYTNNGRVQKIKDIKLKAL